jgi:hypothetical protein
MKKLVIAAILAMMATTSKAEMSDQEFYQLLEMSDRQQMLNNQQEMIQLERQAQQQQQEQQQYQYQNGQTPVVGYGHCFPPSCYGYNNGNFQ